MYLWAEAGVSSAVGENGPRQPGYGAERYSRSKMLVSVNVFDAGLWLPFTVSEGGDMRERFGLDRLALGFGDGVNNYYWR